MRGLVNALLSITALVWLSRLLVMREPVQEGWALQSMLAVAALLAGCWGAVHQYRHWAMPIRRLHELLPQIHRGEISIDRLSEIENGPRTIVPHIQELLRELSSQRSCIAELEIELRHRAATRTTALERTIGSLRQQATRDALTGLFNRRFLDQYLAQSVQRHVKEQKDLCLLMIDVDHFKLLNDTLGHAAGDRSAQIDRAAHPLGHPRGRRGFRWGGDEFVILLPGGSSPKPASRWPTG